MRIHVNLVLEILLLHKCSCKRLNTLEVRILGLQSLAKFALGLLQVLTSETEMICDVITVRIRALQSSVQNLATFLSIEGNVKVRKCDSIRFKNDSNLFIQFLCEEVAVNCFRRLIKVLPVGKCASESILHSHNHRVIVASNAFFVKVTCGQSLPKQRCSSTAHLVLPSHR